MTLRAFSAGKEYRGESRKRFRCCLEQLEARWLLAGEYVVNQTPRVQLGDAPLVGYPGSDTDQIEILWQTKDSGTAATDSFLVEYRRAVDVLWTDAGAVGTIDTQVETRIVHFVEIKGLDYSTDYEYRVTHLRDGNLLNVYQAGFRTRLPAGDNSDFSFVAYGDSADISHVVPFRAVSDRINQIDPDFVMLLGDNIYGDGTHQEADARFDPLLSPEATEWIASHVDYFVVGNHDAREETGFGQPSRDSFSVPIPVQGVTSPASLPSFAFPEHNYSFDYGDVHFVTFDTEQNSSEEIDALLSWVEADLAATTATWKVVAVHDPLAGTPDKSNSPDEDYYQQAVSRLNAAGVDLFLAGHSHTYSWTYPLTGETNGVAEFVLDTDNNYEKGAGLVQVVSGVGGRSLRPGDYSQFPFVAAGYTTDTTPPLEFGFAQIDVTEDQLTVSYVAADDGAIINQFRITAADNNVARIGDFVWEDTNENGIQEAAEVGVEGVTVELIDPGGNGQIGGGDDSVVAQRTTAANGLYQFLNVSPGTYYLRFSNLPEGYDFSPQQAGTNSFLDSDADPTTGLTDLFAVTAGQQDLTRDVGLLPPSSGGGPQSSIEVRVSSSSDDAEEHADGEVGLTSSDLELTYDKGGSQTVGMRFNNVVIPQGATIVSASVQFQTDEASSDTTSLVIQGQDIDHAPVFVGSDQNISSRDRTTASQSWDPSSWINVGQAGTEQETPDIANVIQEIIDRGGWTSGNSLAILITGIGERTAESFDGDSEGAPLLRVSFTTTAPPIVTTTAASLQYTEGDGAVPIDQNLLLEDEDSTDLVGATVTVSGGNGTEDQLGYLDQDGIVGSLVDTTLTLSGVASIVDYQAALRRVTYRNNSISPSETIRSVTFTVDDGESLGADSRNISITTVNSLPTISTTIFPLDYTEDDGPIAIDPDLSLSDVDDMKFSGATIVISGGVVTEDRLLFTNQNGITGSFASTTLTLSGEATVADYQAALRSVAYENISHDPNLTPRMVSFTIDDGSDTSQAAREITIAALNDPPEVATTPSTLLYRVGDGTEAIDTGLTVSDEDDMYLQSAAVTIVGGNPSEDVLGFLSQNGIMGVFAGTTLTLSGAASVAAYQQALRSVTYENTNLVTTDLSTRMITFTVNDTSLSGQATRDIAFASANAAPEVTPSVSSLTYSPGAGALLIDTGISVSDADDAQLVGATVEIVDGISSEDVLGFTAESGITGTFSESTLTLTGTSSIANYQAVLRSVWYENTSGNPNATTRMMTFTVDDGELIGSGKLRVVIPETFKARVSSSSDDAEERADGEVGLTSSDLELTYDKGGSQAVGMRFNNVVIPQGANIVSASVQFQTDEVSTEATSLVIQGQDIDHAPVFVGSDQNISLRDRTTASQSWDPSSWINVGQASMDQETPDIANVIQEIIDRGGWASGNSLAVIITGTGERTAESFDGDPQGAPLLRVSFTTSAPPTVTATAASLQYTEGDGAVPIDPNLLLEDENFVDLVGATVMLTGGNVAEDQLAFVDQNGITGSLVDTTLTLSGIASIADYQAALRSVTYANTSITPSEVTRRVTFTVDDGDSVGSDSRNISVTAVNSLPTISTTILPLGYNEDDGPVAIDSNLTLGDLDDTLFDGATVTISGGLTSEDVLAFTNQNGITGSFASSTLTLSGPATIADYEAALRSVTYENTSHDPSLATRTVTFTIDDGSDTSQATRVVTVAALNDPPQVMTTVAALDYVAGDGAVKIDPGLLLTDLDNSMLTGATIQISGRNMAEDVLAFDSPNSITGSLVDTTLTLSGNASVADYQAALRSITYRNTNLTDPDNSTRTVSFTVTDGIDPGNSSRDILVSDPNRPPTVTATVTNLAYQEGDGPVPIDPALSIVDTDDVNLVGATIAITDGDPTEDILGFVSQNGIIGSFDGTMLMLFGTSSVANYQSALRSVTYENSSDNPNITSRTITFTVDDGNDTGFDARQIDLTAINDAPEVSTTTSTFLYRAGDGAVAIDAALTISDKDDTQIQSATVTIGGGNPTEDLLGFVNNSEITGVFSAATLTLTLSGASSVANYEAALRSVTFENTNLVTPDLSTRTITFTVNDLSMSGQGSRTITVSSANETPEVTPSVSRLVYSPGAGAVVIDAEIGVSDGDDSQLVGATVEITDGTSNEDVLRFTNQNGITGSFSGALLTLSGTASVAAYQAALRTVQYENTSGTSDTTTRTVTFTVDDGDATGSGKLRVVIPETFEVRVSSSSDDAEERASGSVNLTSSDLELTFDRNGYQTVGMRFNNILIPQSATIVRAWLQFQIDETPSQFTSLLIQGQAIDDATTFDTEDHSITSRVRTTAAQTWDPPPWTEKGLAGPDQRTTDISSVIQEIVDRTGWEIGNSLAIIISGSGERVAESFDGDEAGAPLLYIEYATESASAAPASPQLSPNARANTESVVSALPESSQPELADDDPAVTYDVQKTPKRLKSASTNGFDESDVLPDATTQLNPRGDSLQIESSDSVDQLLSDEGFLTLLFIR